MINEELRQKIRRKQMMSLDKSRGITNNTIMIVREHSPAFKIGSENRPDIFPVPDHIK